jgi:hypothetical protein
MGPTSCRPGTQYYNAHLKKNPEKDAFFTVEAGSVVLMHYDLVHAANPNISDKARFMFKFQFLRMDEPGQDDDNLQFDNSKQFNYFEGMRPILSWNDLLPDLSQNGEMKSLFSTDFFSIIDSLNKDTLKSQYKLSDNKADLVLLSASKYVNSIEPIVMAIWKWLTREKMLINTLDDSLVKKLESHLLSENEAYRFYCAFTLAGSGHFSALLEQIKLKQESRFYVPAALALAIGSPNESHSFLQGAVLEELSRDPNYPKESALYLYILASIDCSTLSIDPILAVLEKSTESDTIINSILVLEKIGKSQDIEVVPHILKMINSPNAQVRYSVALSLARLGKKSEKATNDMIAILQLEPNRYVQGFALTALKRIKSEKSQEFLINYLWDSRWDPLTSAYSPW